MRSFPSPTSLSAAVMIAFVLRWSMIEAQAAPVALPPISAILRTTAKKLTNEAIAAESAKDYVRAISLYQQAYRVMPHPILQFNIGQVYRLVGDLVEAERYYRVYLVLDPNGQAASMAREFLASHPARSPELGEVHPTTPIDSTLAKKPQQTSDVSDPGGPSHTPDAAERSRRARSLKRTGYKLLGGGLGLGVVAFGLAFYRADVGRGLGIAALLTTSTGIGVAWYANNQIRAAKSIAWSPMLGPGLTGVAFTGTLPR